MIDIKHLSQNVERYRHELTIRGGNPDFASHANDLYESWKQAKSDLDDALMKKNEFNKKIATLTPEEKVKALEEMKVLSESSKELETKSKSLQSELKKAVSKVPNLSYDDIPVGKSDADNPVVGVWGEKPEFSFTPKPYYELEAYKQFVDQKA